MNKELRKDYYGYRFEDAKLYPVETCKALCETLNAPQNMIALYHIGWVNAGNWCFQR